MTKHRITAEWLLTVATASGGYTKPQLTLLGVDWPPRPGWKSRLIGTEIDAATAITVEQLAINSMVGSDS